MAAFGKKRLCCLTKTAKLIQKATIHHCTNWIYNGNPLVKSSD